MYKNIKFVSNTIYINSCSEFIKYLLVYPPYNMIQGKEPHKSISFSRGESRFDSNTFVLGIKQLSEYVLHQSDVPHLYSRKHCYAS